MWRSPWNIYILGDIAYAVFRRSKINFMKLNWWYVGAFITIHSKSWQRFYKEKEVGLSNTDKVYYLDGKSIAKKMNYLNSLDIQSTAHPMHLLINENHKSKQMHLNIFLKSSLLLIIINQVVLKVTGFLPVMAHT